MRADTSRKRLRLCQFIAFCFEWYEWISRVEFNCVVDRGAGVFLPGGQRHFFLLKRHCQQKQILVVMPQFEILVDMIEFQFAQDRPVSRKCFILLICYFGSINFWPMPTFFNKRRVQNLNLKVCCILQKPLS